MKTEMIELNKVYNEDCLDLLSKIDSESVDLVVTSPPYDNMRTYDNDVDKTWGEQVWKPIIKELYRVIKYGGVVVWNVNDATIDGSETGTSFRQALFFMECGFNLHDTMIWEKTCNGCLGSNNCYLQNFEYMFVFSKGKPAKFNAIEDRKNVVKAGKEGIVNSALKDGKGTDRKIVRKEFGKRTNIWRINQQQNSDHPAPFPIELARDHIVSWSNEGDTVLDPFMGSGTTAIACIKEKRHFIGSEISPKYCKMCESRIKSEISQLSLF